MTDSQTFPDNLNITGIGVSRGIVIGQAQIIGRPTQEIHEVVLEPDQVEKEIDRFNQALKASVDQLEELRGRVAKILGEKDARIFDGHLMLVADEVIIDEVKRRIRSECRNAEFVFNEVTDRYARALSQVSDSYIRDRLADIRDVADRVMSNLRGVMPVTLDKVTEPSVIIAYDISPSDTAAMTRENVLGFVTAVGSRTSHSAIMARSMNIPAVVGATGILNQINTGDQIIVDGLRGRIIARPDGRTIERYRRRLRSQQEWWRIVEAEMALPAETVDGYRAQLAANIELPEEVELIRQSYGVGVGLFRTEYLFIDREEIPTEAEQYEAYRQVAEDIFPHSVIIRTLDIGGDKFMTKLQMPIDMNPFLGVRAIRFCLQRPDIFITQLRAILRATAHGKVRVMFPMIATVEELQKALVFLEAAKTELDEEGIEYSKRIDVGIMIEVPSAAIIADRLAKQVDFFSIGTNDLVQYSLAADRGNPDVANLYQPGHPSIIRLLKHVADAAAQEGKWVSLCGEMASDPLFVPLILGLGIHELSMGIHSIGIVKRLIRRIRMYDAEKLVDQAMTCDTAQEVINLCEGFVARTVPDLLPKLRM
ncbi:MAG: phosphoenolpyruvate--protein phosphotransferase [Lentisphaeria bacterium]|nr:phosphoenolpyruvate--protein phosphotransferase [Lentisphaeria bacterium]